MLRRRGRRSGRVASVTHWLTSVCMKSVWTDSWYGCCIWMKCVPVKLLLSSSLFITISVLTTKQQQQTNKQKDNRWQYGNGFAWLTIPLSFSSFSSSSHFFSPIILKCKSLVSCFEHYLGCETHNHTPLGCGSAMRLNGKYTCKVTGHLRPTKAYL